MQHRDDSKSHLVAPEQLEDENEIQFHIHQANGIRICDRFLLGLCKEGERCQLHHTRYPYHWQVMRKKKGVWQSVNESAQQHLEKLYSNVNDSLVTLVEKDGSKGKVNLNAMELYSFGPYGKIRRLSTNTHDPQQNPQLHTEWHMYWLDETNWKEYEEVRRERGKDVGVGIGWEDEGNQNILKQNKYLSYSLLRTLPNGCRGHLNPYAANIPGEDPTDVYSGPYPASWISCPSEGPTYVQCEIAPSEAVYRTVYTLFHKSLSEDTFLVLGIYRIRQEYLWQKYSSQKEIMSPGLSTEEKKQLEQHLFHGTSADSKNSICQMGFDPRLSGQHLASFGKGSYFAKNAQYSNGFCTACKAGLRYMFLAKVLVGKSAVGNANYCQPPRIRSSGPPFDSCVDSTSSIYVIFNSSQSYPYFLIRYKLLSDPVALDGS
ncbi:TCDD-inducible poly(ADP-ribose) polymerase [Chelydra serpentina]|uniref:TCDD-inducible poly(ADP-ribose) polymerase n=1 Tax=Chelydra serpentina TaxID=8475 RepID=A0A8T1T984_CHESE|nr:TCDD-inducible poly(ADP-ribose) polymerase [Chelydra serpentina]